MEASHVDLRRLRQFLAVLEAGGVREASRRIRIAQPALSRTVAELEDELGLPLFERAARRLVPTEAALTLAVHARSVLAEVDAFVARASALAGGGAGRLHLGTSPSATFHPLVPDLVRAFRNAHPDVELELTEGSTTALLATLVERRIDAAFVRPAQRLDAALAPMVLAQEPPFAVVPRRHVLAGRRSVRVASLFEHPLLLPSTGLGSSLDALVERLALEAGARLVIAARASHVASLVHLAATGMGVAIVPACLRSLRTRDVRFVPVIGARARLPLVLVHRVDAKNPALPTFASLARSRR
ncbi:MAG: LysR family transcriptional regulator [Polyangiaceae bacterium]|nr:LysR family transcriptional regulator [Polyangiaceae bacterium]